MPLMSLVMSPGRAAAILLPVLIAQDAVTVFTFRRAWDRTLLQYTLPGAVLGILLAAMTASYVSDAAIRLVVGVLAVLFCLSTWFGARGVASVPRPHNLAAATTFATISGYSSFVIHAGGPPYNMYALPRCGVRDVFVGTSAVFFALVNLVKLPPFIALGQFTPETLGLSLVLIPIAIVANMAGIQIVRWMPTRLFYMVIYMLTCVIGMKLAFDGASAILVAPT
jgi:uncharacterized protein